MNNELFVGLLIIFLAMLIGGVSVHIIIKFLERKDKAKASEDE